MLVLFLFACTGSAATDSGTEPTDTVTDTDTSGSVTDTASCLATLPADEPAACATATIGEYLDACLWDNWGDDLVLTGTFTAFDAGGSVFLAADGTSYDLGGGTPGVWADLPDLVSAGTVNVRIVGGCGAYGEGTAGLEVTSLEGDLLLLTGRGPGPWTIGEWSAERVDAGCGERDAPQPNSCTACQEPQPVSVVGPESLEAWPGDPALSANYRLVVGISYHGRVYVCADGPGEDVAAWYVVPG